MEYKNLASGVCFHKALELLTITEETTAIFDLHEDTELAIRLPHWGDGVFIQVQQPDENSFMSHPYLYVASNFGRVPWEPSQVEMFSNNWIIVYKCESE